jgi:hypothetical protein
MISFGIDLVVDPLHEKKIAERSRVSLLFQMSNGSHSPLIRIWLGNDKFHSLAESTGKRQN